MNLEATAADLKWLADPTEEPEPFGDNGTKMAWNTFNVVSLYPNGSPALSDVNQRWVGDCARVLFLLRWLIFIPVSLNTLLRIIKTKHTRLLCMIRQESKYR